MSDLLQSLKQTTKSLLTQGFFRVNGGRQRAICRMIESTELTPESMVLAYLQGLFPLGQPDGQLHWQTPDERAVISIDKVHVSKRLKTYLKKDAFQIRFNEQFAEIVLACADREQTWINQPLIAVYQQLHDAGIAHSVEAYQDDLLVGGGFGLSIGNVFFLESMFCRVDQASKVAFVKLAEQLQRDGFEWIDCQYLSEHWKRFGARSTSLQELVSITTQGLSCGATFLKSSDVPHDLAIGAQVLPVPVAATAPII
ncbi:MAG: leucyl/phenylalanyl-tRNA--protein transferase [Bythopirellula sp.]